MFGKELFFLEKKTRLVLVNPQGERLLGMKSKDMLGKDIAELAKEMPITHSELAQGIVSPKDKAIQNLVQKKFTVSKNLILSVSTLSFAEEQGGKGSLVILHDITHEERVEQLKSEFVSIAAHALRTPLAGIKWSLKSLLNKEVGDINNEQEELLDKTAKANARLIKLVNDLLNVTKIEEGRSVYKQELGNITDIIDTVIENALQCASAGFTVTIRLERTKDEIRVSVTDTGVGIPPHEKEHIFTKFFRGEEIALLSPDGSGLGLFMTKNIIEAHGGKVWFESEVGKGSPFSLSLAIPN